jgi:hypothetical protein
MVSLLHSFEVYQGADEGDGKGKRITAFSADTTVLGVYNEQQLTPTSLHLS